MKKVLFLVAALFAVTLSPVYAQETPAKVPDATAVSDEDDAAADDSATEAEKVLDKDLAKFWGRVRKIKTVTPRMYRKSGRFEIEPFAGIIPNDEFLVYFPLGGRLGYHFSEGFSVEASFAYNLDKPSKLTSFLEENIGLKRADIQEILNLSYNVDILWAPIYGKISFLGTKIAHFDTYIGVGVGLVHTTQTTSTNPEPQSSQAPAGNTVLGFRWFINDNLSIRTEYRQFFFSKHQGGVSIPVELTLGLGIII